MWHCHLSHDPLAAPSLDHRCTLVQVTYNHVQIKCIKFQDIPKTEQWKTVDKLNCKTMTTVKLLYTSSNESTCVQLHASDIQLVTSENSWHQIQNSDMNITWTEITRHQNPKLLKLANIYKPMNSFCKMVGQLLQTELDHWTTVSYTASASSSELTASVVSWMTSALKNVYIKLKQQNASKYKNNWCIQVQMTCTQVQKSYNQVQMICTPFFWLSCLALRSWH